MTAPQTLAGKPRPPCASLPREPNNPAAGATRTNLALSLSRQHEMPAPILLPALFRALRAERALFAQAHRVHAVGGDAQRDQELLHRLRARFAEPQVVLRRPALVAVPLDVHPDLRIAAQKLGCLGQRVARVGANVRLVVIKEGVSHVSAELFFEAGSGFWGGGGGGGRAPP